MHIQAVDCVEVVQLTEYDYNHKKFHEKMYQVFDCA